MRHFAASMSTLIVVCISSIAYTSAAATSTSNTCERPINDVQYEKTELPAVVKERFIFPNQFDVTFENVQEDLVVLILAHPHINNKADCPANKPNSSLPYIVKYHDWQSFSPKNEVQNKTYHGIFTGCYYIQLKNNEEKYWVKGPIFYNTTTPYHYYIVDCINSGFSPEDSEATREHYTTLSIPLKCQKVVVSLWELTGDVPKNITEIIENGDTPVTQTCEFTMKSRPTCDYPKAAPRLKRIILSNTPTSGTETWTVEIRWTNLKREGASYYSTYALKLGTECIEQGYSEGNVNLWRHAHQFGLISHGFQNPKSNNVGSTNPEHTSDALMITGYVALGVIITLILLYWIWKYRVIKCATRSTKHISHEIPRVMTKLDDVKESRQILLLYANGSPDFTDKMNTFRDEIQLKCQCRVYDLQSEEDANMIADMGPIRWTEQMLREGSKVIWVDTPQLRSLLKNSDDKSDEEMEEYGRDFRNPALLFALDHIISIAQNVIGQYQRYFVVRCKEFKVDDDNDGDPLLAVSPQARYPIPERFEDLCKDICDSMPPVK